MHGACMLRFARHSIFLHDLRGLNSYQIPEPFARGKAVTNDQKMPVTIAPTPMLGLPFENPFSTLT